LLYGLQALDIKFRTRAQRGAAQEQQQKEELGIIHHLKRGLKHTAAWPKDAACQVSPVDQAEADATTCTS